MHCSSSNIYYSITVHGLKTSWMMQIAIITTADMVLAFHSLFAPVSSQSSKLSTLLLLVSPATCQSWRKTVWLLHKVRAEVRVVWKLGLTMSPGPSPLRRVRAWGWGSLGMRHWPEYYNRFNLDDDACHIPSRDASVHWHITDASYRIVAGWIQVKNILHFLIPGSTQTRYWINASLVLF